MTNKKGKSNSEFKIDSEGVDLFRFELPVLVTVLGGLVCNMASLQFRERNPSLGSTICLYRAIP